MGHSGAPLRAEPWLMDDEAIAALGLSLPRAAAGPGTDVGGSGNRGGAATSAMAASVDGTAFRVGAGTHGSAATSAMPTWWEAQLCGFLRMAGSEGAEGEDPAAQLRSKLLLGTMRAMSPAERFALRSRLEDPLPDDELARLFAQRLGRSSRERLLAVLSGLPADSSARSEGGDEPNAEAPRAEGGDAMWRHVVGEASTAVGVFGRVSAPRGVRLRTRPAAGAPELGILPFDALVSVERRTKHGWCWVVPTEGGSPGFCEEPFLALDPPEPTAHLHRVAPGASLRSIAASYYGEQFRGGRDARLYVQALYEANKGRKGVYLTEVELGRATTVHRSEAEERTLEIFQGVKVRKGHALWVPSERFIEQLRVRGAISSGSSEISQAWRGAKAAVGAVVDAASYGAAFTVGLLEGAWGAIVELFQGAADMIELVAKTVFQLVTGELGAIKATLLGWVEKLAGAWASRDKIADAFMQKWEAEDGWERGNFQGEVLGWVMMTALLIFATAGQGAVAMATGKWASVLRALRALDALGDVTTYVGKAVRLPGKAAALVRRRVGKGLEEGLEGGVEGLEEGVEEGLDALDSRGDLSQAGSRAADASEATLAPAALLEEIDRAAGGLRKPALHEIHPTEMERLRREFAELGGDPEMLRFNRGVQTSYNDETNLINVRGDVFPVEGAMHPRSAMTSRAVLAHELGHAAHRGTRLEPGAWNDEFRASYWAAKNLTVLSDEERIHLLLDAMERAREAGVPFKPNALMRKVIYGY